MKNKMLYQPSRPASVRVQEIESREWWLWGFAVTVTLVLAAGIIALSFPGYLPGTDTWFWTDLKERVRGLAALVLLFDIYTVYQHLQLQRLRKQLAEGNELFELITENAADMIAVVDNHGNPIYYSPAYQRVLGYMPGGLRAQAPADEIHPSDRDRVCQATEKARLTGREQRLEYRMRHKDGSWRILESTASAICGPNGETEKLVVVNRDVTERKRAEEMLAHNAFHDLLTNLPNRALFLDRVQQASARARRHLDYRFAVLFIDIDEFKLFNDSLGHAAGDELLVQIGRRLASCFRESDTISHSAAENLTSGEEKDSLARLGGDEFTVLLEDISTAGDAVRVAQRIQDRWSAPFVIGEQEVVISACIGIALSRSTCSEAENLVRDAELAMYRAKRAGRARCEVFDPAMHATAVHRLNLERELRRAIETRELKVYYQPIVALETGRIVGFEALSRWQRPEGLVLPSEFIPVADETGLIVPINRRLYLDACEQLRRWQFSFPSEPPLMMSVNIAPKQFAQSDLTGEICLILQRTGVSPKTLQLEIMETVAMREAEKAAQVLAELRALGLRLSIDDFGTGYSSLSRLQRLPVDTLKVDRTFISTMDEDPDSQEIVRLIITMARTLKLKVVAEGVETERQIGILKQLNCEMAQGYFFSRPVPAEDITNLLRKNWESAAASIEN
jgi:diguanylate cyclase (GGDEF)-like protein/PAS domain S-box-containing protein